MRLHLPAGSAGLLLLGGLVPPASASALPPQDEEASADAATPSVVAVRAERVVVRPGETLEDATVLVRDGRIVGVGADVAVPEGARVLEAPVVCAAFIDAWSTLGLDGGSVGDERTDAATRAVDAFDPWGHDHARDEALAAGVVLTRVQTGALAAIGGIGAVLRTSGDDDASIVLADAALGAAIGVGRPGQEVDPFERIEAVDRLVGELEDGKEYREDQLEYARELAEWEAEIAEKEKELEDDFSKAKRSRERKLEEAQEEGEEFKEKRYREDRKPRKPNYDAEEEVLARVVDGELPLVVEVHGAPELRALLERTKPFPRLRLVIAGGTESLAVADELKARRIPVVVHPAPVGAAARGAREGHDLSLAGRLDEAGVTVLLGSGGGARATRDLPLLAQLAVAHGLDREAALAALTSSAARALDLADRFGAVRRGGSADLLLLSGDPLDGGTHVRAVLAAGDVVYEATND